MKRSRLMPNGCLNDYGLPFVTMAMDEIPPELKAARKPSQNGTPPMARDAVPPKTSLGPADVMVRLIKAMRDMGATDDEIIAAIAGDAPIAQDDPPRTPGTPIAPSDRENYPGLTTYPYPDKTATAMDEAMFRTRWPGAPHVGVDYRPLQSVHHASPAAAADFFERFPDAARLG